MWTQGDSVPLKECFRVRQQKNWILINAHAMITLPITFLKQRDKQTAVARHSVSEQRHHFRIQNCQGTGVYSCQRLPWWLKGFGNMRTTKWVSINSKSVKYGHLTQQYSATLSVITIMKAFGMIQQSTHVVTLPKMTATTKQSLWMFSLQRHCIE